MDSPVLTMGRKTCLKLWKFPHDVTLTLQQVKFMEETPYTTTRVK